MVSIFKVIEYASKMHEGQYDRDNKPYILHPLAVGMMGENYNEKVVGILHDVMEDCNVCGEDLRVLGISEDCIEALKLLTHRKKEIGYFDYVQKIIDSHNMLALKVKHNDLLHNYRRGVKYPDLQKKHGKALQMVEDALHEYQSE
jgi:(p)ppGpp synthase/HD superfamily hydrolase